MSDSKLEILLAAKDETQKAFLSASASARSFGDKTQTAFLKAEGYAKSFTSKIFSMQGAMVGIAGAAGLGLFIDKSYKAIDVIGKTADRIGISTSALQEYRYAADKAGVTTSAMDKGIEKFSKNLGEARSNTGTLVTFLNKYDKQLLSNIQNSKSTEDALNLIFEAMSNTSSAADRAALANAAFGRSGIAMTNMVKNGVGALNDLRKEAEDLGVVMDEKMIRNAERANDEMSKLANITKVQFMNAIAGLAPEIAHLAEETTNWWKANKGFVQLKVGDAFRDIKSGILDIKNIYDSLPKDVVGPAGVGLLVAIIGRSPMLGVLATGIALTSKKIDEFKLKHPEIFGYKAGAPGHGVTGSWEEESPQVFDTGLNMGYYGSELGKYQQSLADAAKKRNKEVAVLDDKLWNYTVKTAVQGDKELMDAYGAYADYEKKTNKKIYDDNKNLTDSQVRLLKMRLRDQTLQYGSFFDGIKIGLFDSRDHFYSFAEAGVDTFRLLHDSSKNVLFSFLTGETENFGNLWERTWRGALEIFTGIIDQIVMKWATSGIGNLFGLNLSGGGSGSLISFGSSAIPSSSGTPSNILTGGGILGKAATFFGGGAAATTGASGLTMAASTAHEAAMGGALASSSSSMLSFLGPAAFLAGAGFIFSKALGSSGPDAPSAAEWIDAWLKGSQTVPGGAADIPQRGGVGWQYLVDKDWIWNMLTGDGAPQQYQYADKNLKDLVDLIYSDFGKYNDFLSTTGYVSQGEPYPWVNAVKQYATWLDLFGGEAFRANLENHAIGGDITRVLRIPGLPAPYPDDGWISAQVGERVQSRNEAQRSGGKRVDIHLHLKIDGREIAYTVADHTEKNPELIDAIERVVKRM